MTQWFEEWYENNYWQLSADIDEAKDTYKAGAASRQAEIDELQKRIDDAATLIRTANLSNTQDADIKLSKAVRILLGIEKGESNE